MPYIRVDPAVMAHLRQRKALGTSLNDTIRKHLGLPAVPRGVRTAPTAPGALLPLIAAGKLSAGETLTWRRRNLHETHTATVDDAGRLVTGDGRVFHTPDSCASAIAGYPCKGWLVWRSATGTTLQYLRDLATA